MQVTREQYIPNPNNPFSPLNDSFTYLSRNAVGAGFEPAVTFRQQMFSKHPL